MGKRKNFNFNVTIKKREMTKQDKLVKDEVMNSYLNQLLSFANKKSKRKLAD